MAVTLECRLHVAEVGKAIRVFFFDLDAAGLEVAIDISAMTTKEVLLLAPGLTVAVAHALTFVTDGTDGLAEFLTVAGTLTAAGDWVAQGHVIGSGVEWWTDRVGFAVDAPLPVA